MLRVCIYLLHWPYVSSPLEKGRAKRWIEVPRRGTTRTSPKHAHRLSSFPRCHPERSEGSISNSRKRRNFRQKENCAEELHPPACVPLLMLDPSTTLRMTAWGRAYFGLVQGIIRPSGTFFREEGITRGSAEVAGMLSATTEYAY